MYEVVKYKFIWLTLLERATKNHPPKHRNLRPKNKTQQEAAQDRQGPSNLDQGGQVDPS